MTERLTPPLLRDLAADTADLTPRPPYIGPDKEFAKAWNKAAAPDDLVERLRERAEYAREERTATGDGDANHFTEAADRIEAQAREIAEETARGFAMSAELSRTIDERDALKARVARLTSLIEAHRGTIRNGHSSGVQRAALIAIWAALAEANDAG